jgi:hypothetical protein
MSVTSRAILSPAEHLNRRSTSTDSSTAYRQRIQNPPLCDNIALSFYSEIKKEIVGQQYSINKYLKTADPGGCAV